MPTDYLPPFYFSHVSCVKCKSRSIVIYSGYFCHPHSSQTQLSVFLKKPWLSSPMMKGLIFSIALHSTIKFKLTVIEFICVSLLKS